MTRIAIVKRKPFSGHQYLQGGFWSWSNKEGDAHVFDSTEEAEQVRKDHASPQNSQVVDLDSEEWINKKRYGI